MIRLFEPGQKVLLLITRLRLFPSNLNAKSSGPFQVVCMTNNVVVVLLNEAKQYTFILNRQRMKHYFRQEVDNEEES